MYSRTVPGPEKQPWLREVFVVVVVVVVFYPRMISVFKYKCFPPPHSSVASPICQERQNEEKSSRFLPFLPDFSSFFPRFFLIFSRYLANFSLSGVVLCPRTLPPPLDPQWLRHCLPGFMVTLAWDVTQHTHTHTHTPTHTPHTYTPPTQNKQTKTTTTTTTKPGVNYKWFGPCRPMLMLWAMSRVYYCDSTWHHNVISHPELLCK